jgi:hypothetical protein
VVQVVSNYTRGYASTNTCGGDTDCPSGTNYYNQHTISGNWTLTDAHGETWVGDLVSGLNHASIRPSGFVYAPWTNATWSQFHAAVKTDTYGWNMPLAARVSPRVPGSNYYLASWSAPQNAGYWGHYITLRGYSGGAQSSAVAYYNDSSGGVDEHDTSIHILGSTGAFSNLSNTVYVTMTLRTTDGDWYFIW